MVLFIVCQPVLVFISTHLITLAEVSPGCYGPDKDSSNCEHVNGFPFTACVFASRYKSGYLFDVFSSPVYNFIYELFRKLQCSAYPTNTKYTNTCSPNPGASFFV